MTLKHHNKHRPGSPAMRLMKGHAFGGPINPIGAARVAPNLTQVFKSGGSCFKSTLKNMNHVMKKAEGGSLQFHHEKASPPSSYSPGSQRDHKYRKHLAVGGVAKTRRNYPFT